jgi:hypothetical protein
MSEGACKDAGVRIYSRLKSRLKSSGRSLQGWCEKRVFQQNKILFIIRSHRYLVPFVADPSRSRA